MSIFFLECWGKLLCFLLVLDWQILTLLLFFSFTVFQNYFLLLMLFNFAPAALTSGIEKLEAYWLLYKRAGLLSQALNFKPRPQSPLVNNAFLFDQCSCFTIAWQQKSQKNSGLAITWTQRHQSLAYCICAWTDFVALQLLACTVLFKILV